MFEALDEITYAVGVIGRYALAFPRSRSEQVVLPLPFAPFLIFFSEPTSGKPKHEHVVDITRELKCHESLRSSEIELHVTGQDRPAVHLLGLLLVPPTVGAPAFA